LDAAGTSSTSSKVRASRISILHLGLHGFIWRFHISWMIRFGKTHSRTVGIANAEALEKAAENGIQAGTLI